MITKIQKEREEKYRGWKKSVGTLNECIPNGSTNVKNKMVSDGLSMKVYQSPDKKWGCTTSYNDTWFIFHNQFNDETAAIDNAYNHLQHAYKEFMFQLFCELHHIAETGNIGVSQTIINLNKKIKCKKHPKYQIKKIPTADCDKCNLMWKLKDK